MCALWLAATLIAGGTLAAVYVQHHRTFYPQLHAHSQQLSGAGGPLGEGGALRGRGQGAAGAGALNQSLAVLEVIRGARLAVGGGGSLLPAARLPAPYESEQPPDGG